MTKRIIPREGDGAYHGEDRASTAARHIKGPPERTDLPDDSQTCPPGSQRGKGRGPLRIGKKPAGKSGGSV
jgi:hypothetical protein